MAYPLNSNDELTGLVRSLGIHSWNDLTDYIRNLSYGRNSNRTDLSLVIKEGKGTCSSKHAFLKKVADLNKIPNVKLLLGIYRMTESNTPKIGDELTKNSLSYIPEAHCYLKIGGTRIDFTTIDSNFHAIEKDLMLEKEIEPDDVAAYKVKYHKDFLSNWIDVNKMNYDFDEIWQIREHCIRNLAK